MRRRQALVVVAVVAALAGLSSVSVPAQVAQPPHTWVASGSMTQPHSLGATVVLPNGEVLVVGGYPYPGPAQAGQLAVERYEPGTGQWRPAATPPTPRNPSGYTATLLTGARCGSHCGQVLLVGGDWQQQPLSTVELYDPASDTWSPAPPVTVPRLNHTATLLADGRVLVAGTVSTRQPERRSAEIFDPAADSWQSTAAMAEMREGHVATGLADGRVLVAGGRNGGSDTSSDPPLYLSQAEVYDPATGLWSGAGQLTEPRVSHSQTLLPDGRVLVAGGFGPPATGQDGLHVRFTSELYNPLLNSWSLGAPMAAGRWGHSATLAECGVLVAGGYAEVNQSSALRSAELYVAATGEFVATGPMSEGRGEHQSARLGDGKVLAAGGASAPITSLLRDPGGWLASSELYQPPPCNVLGVPALPALPVVTGIDPGRGPMAGGTRVEVSGSGFDDAISVRFGLQHVDTHPCPSEPAPGDRPCFNVESDSRIVVYSPSRPADLGPARVHVSVFLPTGNSLETPADFFEYFQPEKTLAKPPAITSVEPAFGPVSGGTDVRITGTNLDTVTAASFGSTRITASPCPAAGGTGTAPCFTVVSPTSLRAYTPQAAAPGVVHVTVDNPDGRSAEGPADQFEYQAEKHEGPPLPPTVTAIDPVAGPVEGGTRVAVSGTGFANVSAVQFGPNSVSASPCPAPGGTGAAPCFTVNSTEGLTVFTPLATGPQRVHLRVVAAAGTSAEVAPDIFEYRNPDGGDGGSEQPPVTDPPVDKPGDPGTNPPPQPQNPIVTPPSGGYGGGTPDLSAIGAPGFTPVPVPSASPVAAPGSGPAHAPVPVPGGAAATSQAAAPASAQAVGPAAGAAPVPGGVPAAPSAAPMSGGGVASNPAVGGYGSGSGDRGEAAEEHAMVRMTDSHPAPLWFAMGAAATLMLSWTCLRLAGGGDAGEASPAYRRA